jgi:hypothetical protein
MARSKGNGGVNMSQAIRDVLAGNPKLRTKEIIAQLADKGIKVRPTLVYYIKSKENQQRKKDKRQRAEAAAPRVSGSASVQLLVKLKQLAADAGGIRYLKQIVDILAE